MRALRPTFLRRSLRCTALATGLLLGVAPAAVRAQTPAPAPAVSAALSAEGAPLPADYKITTGDQLDFNIYGEADVATTQRVSAAGDIRLPLIGTIVVQGLTLRDAELRLEKLYVDGGFYVEPQVILSVRQYIERTVSVLGQVNRPDRIVFPVETHSIGIVRAITLAGGLTRIAKTDAVVVTRPGRDGKETRTIINLGEYLDSKTGNVAEEFKLLPGDIVYVPERNF